MKNLIYSLIISIALLLVGCGNSKQSFSSSAVQGGSCWKLYAKWSR